MTRAAQKASSRLVELGLGAAWLVGLAAALQALDQLSGAAELRTPLFGALAVDLLAGRAGVRWDWDDTGIDSRRHAVRRTAAGAAVALIAGGLVIAVAAVLRWLHGEAGARPSAALGIAVARTAAVAVRDELLFRGIPLAAAARAQVPAPVARAFAALLSGATIVMLPGVTPAAVALSVGSGWLFAALWERDRGAWAAVGAHAAWLLLVGSALHGGLFDVEWTHGELAVGASAAGAPAWVAAAMLTAAGFAVLGLPWAPVRGFSPHGARDAPP